MALDNASRFMYGLIIIGGSIFLFFGVIMGVWYPYSGTIWDAQHHSGCETCPKLVVKFIFKSADKYYSGAFKEHVDYPYKSNTTLEDMYALHPIGTPVNMYVNPLFNSESTLNGYPWGTLAGVIPLLLSAVFLFFSVYFACTRETIYNAIS